MPYCRILYSSAFVADLQKHRRLLAVPVGFVEGFADGFGFGFVLRAGGPPTFNPPPELPETWRRRIKLRPMAIGLRTQFPGWPASRPPRTR